MTLLILAAFMAGTIFGLLLPYLHDRFIYPKSEGMRKAVSEGAKRIKQNQN